MKVLVAGANGYLGRHVTERFLNAGFNVYRYQRSNAGGVPICCEPTRVDEIALEDFDVVINCARPHWSQYQPDQIAQIESELLSNLELYASPNAIKIHTSGVWLFGHATKAELHRFEHKPFESVERDVKTIVQVLTRNWHVVYCPSLIYGGEDCQLRRILEERKDRAVDVALPSSGYNQYVHVADVAQFYLDLVVSHACDGKQHFIAEDKGYSPLAFAERLQEYSVITSINRYSWEKYQSKFASNIVDIEKLHLDLPISKHFSASHKIDDYLAAWLEP